VWADQPSAFRPGFRGPVSVVPARGHHLAADLRLGAGCRLVGCSGSSVFPSSPPDYPGWEGEAGESGEGDACRFFCCAKDHRWIRYLRERDRFIISPRRQVPGLRRAVNTGDPSPICRSRRCCPRFADIEGFSVSVISGLSRGFNTCCLRFKSDVATTPAKIASGWLAFTGRESNPIRRALRWRSWMPLGIKCARVSTLMERSLSKVVQRPPMRLKSSDRLWEHPRGVPRRSIPDRNTSDLLQRLDHRVRPDRAGAGWRGRLRVRAGGAVRNADNTTAE
jgi:hypothetical protein